MANLPRYYNTAFGRFWRARGEFQKFLIAYCVVVVGVAIVSYALGLALGFASRA